MDRFRKRYSKEYMKMAMLKHEETFREQVSELHRLYRVQKMLMTDLKREKESGTLQGDFGRWNGGGRAAASSQGFSDQRSSDGGFRRTFDLERPADEYAGGDDSDEGGVEIELTLATGSGSGIGNGRRREKWGAPLASDCGPSFSSSSTTESGGETVKLRGWGAGELPRGSAGYSAGRSGLHVVEEAARRQDRLSQPSWHYQCLGLNMT